MLGTYVNITHMHLHRMVKCNYALQVKYGLTKIEWAPPLTSPDSFSEHVLIDFPSHATAQVGMYFYHCYLGMASGHAMMSFWYYYINSRATLDCHNILQLGVHASSSYLNITSHVLAPNTLRMVRIHISKDVHVTIQICTECILHHHLLRHSARDCVHVEVDSCWYIQW